MQTQRQRDCKAMRRELMRRAGLFFLVAVLMATGSAQGRSKPFFLWIDAHANFARLNSPESVAVYMDRAKYTGVTDIVIDLKPIDGYVLYPSVHAPQLLEWKGVTRSREFDYAGTLIREARSRGMKAHLSVNVFSEGNKLIRFGRAYEDSVVRSWGMQVLTPTGIRHILDAEEEIAAFVNPALREVQDHELHIIEESTRIFKPDGMILDRCRYTGIRTDFSPTSRDQFEQTIGKRIDRWPGDILTLTVNDGKVSGYDRGPLFKQWIEWRSSVIAAFFVRAKEAVKRANPSTAFADYVGAWYPPYYEVGVNWASSTFDPAKEYDWATEAYSRTGYADLLDFLMVGTYFFEVRKDELLRIDTTAVRRSEAGMRSTKEAWYSVEGSAELAMRVTRNVTPVYGSLYVEQYRGYPDQFARAVGMTARITNGLMIFDLVHIEQLGWWDVLKNATVEVVR